MPRSGAPPIAVGPWRLGALCCSIVWLVQHCSRATLAVAAVQLAPVAVSPRPPSRSRLIPGGSRPPICEVEVEVLI
ncbi:hypothetical protein Zm00014a_023831 [Zea mays]|uniref:Secreted protein n=2 Tax=Zea mays TaxID=4577 RepID=A0A8J8Y7R0_MAIZE|nr:hypothetical protein ZEAMMB73_Zm00001d038144 [Zea mays]PWZ16788.1 hypothetical protein Zm00014a_023831 [Zea mays]